WGTAAGCWSVPRGPRPWSGSWSRPRPRRRPGHVPTAWPPWSPPSWAEAGPLRPHPQLRAWPADRSFRVARSVSPVRRDGGRGMQVLLAAVLAASVALAVPPPAATASPSGSDHPKTLHVARAAQAPGDGSSARPYPRIAQALAVAMPGDTVLVGPGRYAEEVRTVRPGRSGAPIRVVGRPGAHLVGPHGRARGGPRPAPPR